LKIFSKFDKIEKIIYNTKGTHGDVSADVKAFLNAIEGKMSSGNIFVEKFEKFAEEIKADETWRKSYMQTAVRIQDKIDAGIERGKIEMAKKLLESGVSIKIIANSSGLSLEEIHKLKEMQQEDQ